MKPALTSLIVIVFISLTLAQTQEQDIYVCSANTNSIKVYDGANGQYHGDFIKPGSGGLEEPLDMMWYGEVMLVLGGKNKNILKFDAKTGAPLGAFTSGYELKSPKRMSIGTDGNLYVSQWSNSQPRVIRFNGKTGEIINVFTNEDIPKPLGHAWDPEGNLYVAALGSQAIFRYNSQGAFTDVFIRSDMIETPGEIWFNDKWDRMYVTDIDAGTVFIFDATNGNFISAIIGGMQKVGSATMGPRSEFYAVDLAANTVRLYQPDGTSNGVFASGGDLDGATDIMLGPNWGY